MGSDLVKESLIDSVASSLSVRRGHPRFIIPDFCWVHIIGLFFHTPHQGDENGNTTSFIARYENGTKDGEVTFYENSTTVKHSVRWWESDIIFSEITYDESSTMILNALDLGTRSQPT